MIATPNEIRRSFGLPEDPMDQSVPLAVCMAHKHHEPANETVELHHVIPQAWQHIWAPPGAALDSNGLWDPRTAPLCPTGHRNVHFWIVRLMKTGLGDPIAMEKVVRSRTFEFTIAKLGVSRYSAAGGDLVALQKRGEWGEA